MDDLSINVEEKLGLKEAIGKRNETVLLTGGAGFIGHHILEHLIKGTDWKIVIIDRLSYAGDLNRIVDSGVNLKRIKFVFHDIRAPLNERIKSEIGHVDYIIHAAAETHVDRSLSDPEPFIYSNFVGTFNMLEYAKCLNSRGILRKFIQVSTDEVYGPAPEGTNWKEWDRLYPSNPYSATKAGADCLCLAYGKSYKLPITVTRTMNNFGERQHPEKFLPMIIRNILRGEVTKVHGEKLDGEWKSGSRIWLHARNHADAILYLLKFYKEFNDPIINIVGDREVSNLEMVKLIGSFMKKEPKWEWFDFHGSRPGHDLRYSLDGTRLKELGWKPPIDFDTSLARMVNWTIAHLKYLEW